MSRYQNCRERSTVLQYSILNKLKNQFLASTSKKQPQKEFKPIEYQKKTPQKCLNSISHLEFTPEQHNYRIGMLKSYTMRQGYFECLFEIMSIRTGMPAQKIKCLVQRDHNQLIETGHAYMIELQQVNMANGIQLIFGQIKKIK